MNRILTATFPFIRDEQKVGQPLLQPGARKDPVSSERQWHLHSGTWVPLVSAPFAHCPPLTPQGDSVMNQWHHRQVKKGQRSVPSTQPSWNVWLEAQVPPYGRKGSLDL